MPQSDLLIRLCTCRQSMSSESIWNISTSLVGKFKWKSRGVRKTRLAYLFDFPHEFPTLQKVITQTSNSLWRTLHTISSFGFLPYITALRNCIHAAYPGLIKFHLYSRCNAVKLSVLTCQSHVAMLTTNFPFQKADSTSSRCSSTGSGCWTV